MERIMCLANSTCQELALNVIQQETDLNNEDDWLLENIKNDISSRILSRIIFLSLSYIQDEECLDIITEDIVTIGFLTIAKYKESDNMASFLSREIVKNSDKLNELIVSDQTREEVCSLVYSSIVCQVFESFACEQFRLEELMNEIVFISLNVIDKYILKLIHG